MPLENGKWRVQRGDCLWSIAYSVYRNGRRWTEIARANGLPQSGSPIIYPGQLFIIPGKTPSVVPNPPKPDPPPPTRRPSIDWFSLTAGTEREMQVIWSFDANHFWIKWEQWDNAGHLWTISEDKNKDCTGSQKSDITSLRDTAGWDICRFSVRPVDNDGNVLPHTDWTYKEYNFKNNPPKLLSSPNVELDNDSNIIVTFENIDTDINADEIEIAVYKNDTIKYLTGRVKINKETNFAKWTHKVDYGNSYTVRARAVRGNNYGGWTEFSSSLLALPIAPKEITKLVPQVINEQTSRQYGILVEWTSEKTATQYEIQYTTDPSYFDISDNVTSVTTDENDGTRKLITNIEVGNEKPEGHEYFFRVGSINSKGHSKNWTKIKSVKIGEKPSAPTTWSNTLSAIVGEDLNLYWVHNATDNSLETFARIHFSIVSPNGGVPSEKTIVIRNEKPEGHESDTNVYVFNTNNPEWNHITDGYVIKWKVQTAGISNEYSDWSIEREVSIYEKPTLTIGLTNQNGAAITEINEFPFNVTVNASPLTQTPISYYIEVVSNSKYETIDRVGKNNIVNIGDKIYQQYYDPKLNAWDFLAVFDPGIIDLHTGANYTLLVTVAMDSGLTAESALDFNVNFVESSYDVYGDVIIDESTLTASIHPYCNEYTEKEGGGFDYVQTEDCLLSVYRREYDGSFTLIAKDIDNLANTFVTDPHPTLDYARYRVVAIVKETGAVSFADIPGVKVEESSVVIQWAEEWSAFDYDSTGNGNKEPNWEGSMIKLPYNVDTSEEKEVSVSTVNYAGRKHPVSYYGTQLKEGIKISVDVPIDDKDTLYQLRRLSAWNNNVYVREPNGIGYWATIKIDLNINHNELVMPVSISVTRVEGGM